MSKNPALTKQTVIAAASFIFLLGALALIVSNEPFLASCGKAAWGSADCSPAKFCKRIIQRLTYSSCGDVAARQ